MCVVLAVAGFAAVGIWASIPADRSLVDRLASGTLRIGYAVEAPYAFVARGGVVTGESVEVARVIAERLGVPRIVWVQSEFGALIEGLEQRRFDIIAAGMFITPQRAERVAFSDPSFRVTPGLLVRRGNPRRIHAYADALAAGARVAVVGGSIEEDLVRRLRFADDRLLITPDALLARRAVETGTADVLALSLPSLRWMTRGWEDEIEIAEPFTAPAASLDGGIGYGAFAFHLSDRALRQAWNAELREFIGTADHLALVARFGFTRDEVPGAVTAAQLLETR